MKSLFFYLTVTLILSFSCLLAQYVPTSPYLQYPELAIGYTDSCAQFWLQTWDQQLGGFFTNIDKYGNVITNWGTNKNMLTQSRNAYGLTRAYMLTGNSDYINLAKQTLNWMYEHAWDTSYSGWYQDIDISGNPMFPSNNKTAFYQHYALLGIVAYYEATGDTLAWNWLKKSYQNLDNIYWDKRTAYLGYFDQANFNNQNAWNKSFNATVDAITTHLLYLYLLTEEEYYKYRLEELASEIIENMVGSMPQQAIGFVEKYDSDWNWNNGETMTIMGHVLKAGWCLARINQLFPDIAYVNAAKYLINDVWLKGYDHEYGGPYKDFNRITGEMLLWGLQDSTKAWWQMEQAIVAGLQMYYITKESWYLQLADETINFYMKFFVDHINGEVYADRTRYGGIAWNEAKGNSAKAGYHSIETGYYTYLYSSLFYTKEPAVLHYNYAEVDFDREFFLTPLAIKDSDLMISQVLNDGNQYNNYDPINRTISIPAGIGGHFEITYENPVTNIVIEPSQQPYNFRLYQNYPNPFNPATCIQYSIPIKDNRELFNVSIAVYDLLGNEVAILVNEYKPAGTYKVIFDASRLTSGVYFYKLKSGDYIQSKKMILIK